MVQVNRASLPHSMQQVTLSFPNLVDRIRIVFGKSVLLRTAYNEEMTARLLSPSPRMQCSIHSPNDYLCLHGDRLLPTWPCAIASVLVVLQPCACDLLLNSEDPQNFAKQLAERQKAKLRQRFLRFGCKVAHQLQQRGALAEPFDPRTGQPVLSPPGPLRLDDVAIVHACLGYPTIRHQGCAVILHPTWGSSVYPSTLLSSAHPTELAHVIAQVESLNPLSAVG